MGPTGLKVRGLGKARRAAAARVHARRGPPAGGARASPPGHRDWQLGGPRCACPTEAAPGVPVAGRRIATSESELAGVWFKSLSRFKFATLES